MSILKDSKNLVFGNGDLFLATTTAGLPSVAAYKAAKAGGTLGTLTGNVGAIKGNAELQIIRDMVAFEIGVPLETADQTVSREGVMFKCSLAELSLVTLQTQLGLDAAFYSTAAAGSTQVLNAALTLTGTLFTSLSHGPVLYTTSVPAATANPVLQNSGGGVHAGSQIPYSTGVTGGATETFTPAGANIAATGTAITIGGTITAGDVVSITFGSGLYKVSYTVQAGDTTTIIATALKNLINGAVQANGTSNPYVTASFTATSAAAVLTVTMANYLEGYDFIIDYLLSGVSRTPGGNIPSGQACQITYYYNQLSSETLTGGGTASVVQSALRFFHPYKDGRVFEATMFKANPVGTITTPFDEIAYALSTFEMKGIADFTQAAGSHLYSLYREITT